MTFGEKLAKLRRENNHTQEELADLLGVSRQSVSKWEQDLAFPETNKLIKIGEIYNCSLDYLFKDGEGYKVEKPENGAERTYRISFDLTSFSFERKSKKMIGNLPLRHVNIGWGRTAKGVFAIGLSAQGIVSVGMFSLGVFSFGLLSIGLISFGVFALGLLAAGCISLGIVSFGAIAIGLLAVGAVAIGQFSVGALAIGNYFALGDHARAAIAIGKTQAEGTLFNSTAITADNARIIQALLDGSVPAVFAWLKALIGFFL